MTYFILSVVNFLYIYLKATQQLNVVWRKYVWVVPTSVLMAACEVYVITGVVRDASIETVAALGIGGGLGCILSMATHKKLTGTKGKKT